MNTITITAILRGTARILTSWSFYRLIVAIALALGISLALPRCLRRTLSSLWQFQIIVLLPTAFLWICVCLRHHPADRQRFFMDAVTTTWASMALYYMLRFSERDEQ